MFYFIFSILPNLRLYFFFSIHSHHLLNIIFTPAPYILPQNAPYLLPDVERKLERRLHPFLGMASYIGNSFLASYSLLFRNFFTIFLFSAPSICFCIFFALFPPAYDNPALTVPATSAFPTLLFFL